MELLLIQISYYISCLIFKSIKSKFNRNLNNCRRQCTLNSVHTSSNTQSQLLGLFVRFPHPTILFDEKSNFLHVWKVNELHAVHRQNSPMRNCLYNNTFPSMCKGKDIPSAVIHAQFKWIKSRGNRNYP